MRILKPVSLVFVTVNLLLVIGGGNQLFGQEPLPPTESLRHAFPGQQHYSPYAGRNSLAACSGAIPICIPHDILGITWRN